MLNVIMIRRGGKSQEKIFDYLTGTFDLDVSKMEKYTSISDNKKIVQEVEKMTGMGMGILKKGIEQEKREVIGRMIDGKESMEKIILYAGCTEQDVLQVKYTGEEEIQFFPNEHFIDQQNEADRERITDTNFTVFGKIQKKYHIECESSYPDGRITIRLFEYDAQIALDEGDITEETLTVTFPNTAVLYLRTYRKTPDKMKYVIVTPGGTVQYDIPVMKVQAYSLDDIFEKHLLMLIPFYIFSHEKGFSEYNSNKQKLEELKAEYQELLERLDELEQQEVIGAFEKRTIVELSGDVIKEISQKYRNVQKGIGDMMRGALIETEARTILNQGINQEKRRMIERMIDANEQVDRIMLYAGCTMEEVLRLKEQRENRTHEEAGRKHPRRR